MEFNYQISQRNKKVLSNWVNFIKKSVKQKLSLEIQRVVRPFFLGKQVVFFSVDLRSLFLFELSVGYVQLV